MKSRLRLMLASSSNFFGLNLMVFALLNLQPTESITLPLQSQTIFKISHLKSINKYRSRHLFTKRLYSSKKLTSKSQNFAEFLADHQILTKNIQHDPKLTQNQGVVGENIFVDQVPKSNFGLKCDGEECEYVINKALHGKNLKSQTIKRYLYKLGKKAASNWYSGEREYNYHTTMCGKDRFNCEHFTALVWRGSRTCGLGLAYHEDREDPRFLVFYVVTRFSPRGNFVVKYHGESYEEASLRDYRLNVKRLVARG